MCYAVEEVSHQPSTLYASSLARVLVLNISNGTGSLLRLYNFLCFAISLSRWLYIRRICTDVESIALKVECTSLSEIYDFSGY
jgi:hypothetical protein